MASPASPRRGPLSRAGPHHPSWAALLDAGVEVAAEMGVAALSTGEVASRAGLAKGTFFVHFASRDDFVVSMHRRCCDDLAQRLRTRTSGVAPGYPRLIAGTTEFLEVCIHHRGTSAVLVQGRFEPALRKEVAERTEQAVAAVSRDLRAAGSDSPQPETAELLVLAALEVAGLESVAGRRLARHRAAFMRLVKRAG